MAAEADKLCDWIMGLDAGMLARTAGAPKSRLASLPLAAATLRELLRRVRPKRVVFSAFGVREGYLSLAEAERWLAPNLGYERA